MIKHIVMWKVHKDGTEQQRYESYLKFDEMTKNLKKIIPEIVETRAGYNTNANDFHICVDAIFKNKEDLETYIWHPEHLKVREFLNSILYEKAIFDYEYEE